MGSANASEKPAIIHIEDMQGEHVLLKTLLEQHKLHPKLDLVHLDGHRCDIEEIHRICTERRGRIIIISDNKLLDITGIEIIQAEIDAHEVDSNCIAMLSDSITAEIRALLYSNGIRVFEKQDMPEWLFIDTQKTPPIITWIHECLRNYGQAETEYLSDSKLQSPISQLPPILIPDFPPQ